MEDENMRKDWLFYRNQRQRIDNTLKVDENNLHTKIQDNDRYVNLQEIITNLNDDYEIDIDAGNIKKLGYEELFIRTKCSRLFYSIFNQVSMMTEMNGTTSVNLGTYEDIRERFVIENIELMFDTIQELVNRVEYMESITNDNNNNQTDNNDDNENDNKD